MSTVEVVATEPGRITKAPTDVLRLGVATATLVVVVLVGVVFGDAVVAFTAELLRGLDALGSGLITAVLVLTQITAVGVYALAVVTIVRLRSGVLAVATVAAAVLGGMLAAVISRLLDDGGAVVTNVEPVAAWDAGTKWTAPALAVLAAVVATISPWVRRSWRRAGWASVTCVAIVHFATTPVGFETAAAVLAGWIAGAAVTVIAGAPSHRPSGASIAQGLTAVGVPLARIEQASVDARGSTPYFATTEEGASLFVKALGADERSADLMFRVYRRLQPRDLGDEKPFSTLRRAVEHEALVALAVRDLGVRTPRFVAFASAQPAGFVLAYEAIAGRSLDRVAPDELTDAVLDAVWAQLALLRAHRAAHRDLRLANVFLAEDGEVWLIDFGFSELAASDVLLATDLAEMVASSATVVGAERAVAAAVRAVGPDDVATAVPRLELPLLSGATRTAMKQAPGLLDDVRSRVSAAGS